MPGVPKNRSSAMSSIRSSISCLYSFSGVVGSGSRAAQNLSIKTCRSSSVKSFLNSFRSLPVTKCSYRFKNCEGISAGILLGLSTNTVGFFMPLEAQPAINGNRTTRTKINALLFLIGCLLDQSRDIILINSDNVNPVRSRGALRALAASFGVNPTN